MNLAFAAGLLSAGVYGVTDFLYRIAGRQVGVLKSMLYGQSLLAAFTTLLLLATHTWPRASATAWALLMISDLLILAGTASLYRGLAFGRLAVVAPVAACYGAVTAGLSVATGERLSAWAAVGLGLALAGGVMAAAPVSGDKPVDGRSRPSSGALSASLSAMLFGAGFWIQGRFGVTAFGELVPVWSYYALGASVVLMVAVATGSDCRPPPLRQAAFIGATASLAGVGYALVVVGQSTGAVGVATALSSLASAVTVLLARFLLKEKVARRGWIGLCLLIAGLMLLHAG